MRSSDLAALCGSAGLPFDPDWLPKLATLQAVLARHNARTNLVGDASPAGLQGHVLEALAVAAAAERALGRPAARVVDVGAGAGLEALTLALAWPQARVLAVEPRSKRAIFTELAADALGLRNLTVQATTLEAARLPPAFSLATARAVWAPDAWLARARPLLAPGGLAVVHGRAPAEAWLPGLEATGWACAATQAVPGTLDHLVAVLCPS